MRRRNGCKYAPAQHGVEQRVDKGKGTNNGTNKGTNKGTNLKK